LYQNDSRNRWLTHNTGIGRSLFRWSCFGWAYNFFSGSRWDRWIRKRQTNVSDKLGRDIQS